MKIAGLLPLKYDPEKSKLEEALMVIDQACDETIILLDGFNVIPRALLARASEVLKVDGRAAEWNDYVNRLTLLARAAKYGCEVVMWLDDDETTGPTLTRERVREIGELLVKGYSEVIVKVRTAWDETHWRTDGIFGRQNKTFFQLNPLMLKRVEWEWGPEKQLHHFPTVVGSKLFVDDWIVHWGMRTLALRQKNVAKYQKQDPEGKFTCVAYNYLLNEEGMALESL